MFSCNITQVYISSKKEKEGFYMMNGRDKKIHFGISVSMPVEGHFERF